MRVRKAHFLLTLYAISISTMYLTHKAATTYSHKTPTDLPTFHSKRPLSLWRDLSLKNDTSRNYFSHHRCLHHDLEFKPSSDFGFPGYVGRTCLYTNLYFQPSTLRYAYVASPQEAKLLQNITMFRETLTTSRGYIPRTLYDKQKKRHESVFSKPNTKFSPEIFTQENAPFQPESAPLLKIGGSDLLPVVMLYRLSFSFNFGHFIFDDVLTMFTMLDMFGFLDRRRFQHVPIPFDLDDYDFFYRCNHGSRWKDCVNMLRRVSPMVGIDPFSKDGEYLDTSKLFHESSKWIRLPKVIVGAGDLAYWGCIGSCAASRSSRIFRMRRWMMEQAGVPQSDVGPERILISLPIGNTHANIEEYKEIIPALQDLYGDNVRVFDLAKLSIRRQIEEVSKAKVYLTNNGGGSATSIFLNEGSTVLLYHQPDGEQRDHDWYSQLGYVNHVFLPAKAPVSRTLDQVAYALSRPPPA